MIFHFNFDIFYFHTREALKIHITAEMNDQLNIIGGFKTEHRGLIDVKVCVSVLMIDGHAVYFFRHTHAMCATAKQRLCVFMSRDFVFFSLHRERG